MSKLDLPNAWADVSRARDAEAFAPDSWQARTVAFVHVNGTGVGPADRPVSLGAVKLTLTPPGEIAILHLVFDPGVEADAMRRHGYSARELKRQDRFEAYAQPLARWLAGADLRVADSAIELRLLGEALSRAGAPSAGPERSLRGFPIRGKRAPTLDAMAAQLALVRNPRHGALRDAWLCMQAFLWMHGLPWRLDYGLTGDPTPSNFRSGMRPGWSGLIRRLP